MKLPSQLDAFQVPLSVHLLSGIVSKYPSWCIRLGDLESRTLRDVLGQVTVDRPVYVSGIARAGTTIVLELLTRHPDVATHAYRDFPGQFAPIWWSRGQSKHTAAPQERAHGDRLHVTPDSPEAMEEPLWMAFFPHLHDPRVNNVVGRDAANEAFERFYLDHLKKMLLVRGRPRYVAKGNYNLTRLAYLRRLLPDARFVVLVRNPRDHVASLIKQHRLFCAGERKYPRALAHMQRVGHFEFGLDRRPVCVGDGVAQQVMDLWEQGEEVRGTARYWASIYNWVADRLEADAELAKAVKLVRYEDLCADTTSTVAELLTHCELSVSPEIEQFAYTIEPPNYYSPEFTAREEQILAEETATTAERFGYPAGVTVAAAGE